MLITSKIHLVAIIYHLGCEYGDSDEESCSQWAKEGQLASRCFTNKQVRENICCKSCRLLVSTIYSGSKKNPISFPLIMMALYTFVWSKFSFM